VQISDVAYSANKTQEEARMISVSIAINGVCIMARSDVNQERRNEHGETAYLVDDGSTVWHDPDAGAVLLAIQLLETIKEPKP
jgi:hypothetical protein